MDAFEAYESSGLDGQFGYLEPSGMAVDFPNGDTYEAPQSETEESFLDRIERSKKVGRNLFKEEWKLFEYEPDCVF